MRDFDTQTDGSGRVSAGTENRSSGGLKNSGAEFIDEIKINKREESKIPGVRVTYAYGDWDSNPQRELERGGAGGHSLGDEQNIRVKYSPGRQQGRLEQSVVLTILPVLRIQAQPNPYRSFIILNTDGTRKLHFCLYIFT